MKKTNNISDVEFAINQKFFGYKTKEEMQKAVKRHEMAYARKKAKEQREEKSYEEWLKKEFY